MAESTFFWYDLETSGRDPRTQRIMQLAGQRTTMELEPVGDPVNILVRLGDDVLPEPAAIALTRITPQATQAGISEAELAARLQAEICTPETIMVGFNSVRFDDEWLRFLFYRTFYDAYDWCWREGRSRWDLLDVIRMVRVLRPEGIIWPTRADGTPVNKLEEISGANGLEHVQAHDAMSDVTALIGVAKLLKDKQPKMYDYLLRNRAKDGVEAIIRAGTWQPFVYTTGMYPIVNNHTSVSVVIGNGRNKGCHVVYDLRHDPDSFKNLSVEELARRLYSTREELDSAGLSRLPVKQLKTNKCPTVAPLGTLRAEDWGRINLNFDQVKANLAKLNSGLAKRMVEAATAEKDFEPSDDVDGALYGGAFFGDADKRQMESIRTARPDRLSALEAGLSDPRLPELLFRYRARNFPGSLDPDEHSRWDSYRAGRINAEAAAFEAEFIRHYTAATEAGDAGKLSSLEDLRLWVQSIYPAE